MRRRQYLSLVGIPTFLALAGCTEDSGEEPSANDTDQQRDDDEIENDTDNEDGESDSVDGEDEKDVSENGTDDEGEETEDDEDDDEEDDDNGSEDEEDEHEEDDSQKGDEESDEADDNDGTTAIEIVDPRETISKDDDVTVVVQTDFESGRTIHYTIQTVTGVDPPFFYQGEMVVGDEGTASTTEEIDLSRNEGDEFTIEVAPADDLNPKDSVTIEVTG